MENVKKQEIEEILKAVIEAQSSTNKPKNKFVEDAKFLINKYHIRKANNQVWFFDNNKWYTTATDKNLTVLVVREFSDKYGDSYSKVKQISNYIEDLVNDKYENEINKKINIFFKNGLLRFNKKEKKFNFYKPEPEEVIFSPAIINDDYLTIEELKQEKDYEKCKKVIDKYFDFFLMDKNGKLRQDTKDYLLSVLLLGHSTYTTEQITFLLAGGGNGKSFFIDLIKELIGNNNFGSFKLNNLKSNFGLQPLLNKTLSADSETKKTQIEEDLFKSICGNDTVNVNIKNKNPIDTKLFSTIILAGNHKPIYKDYSNGISRRFIIIPIYSKVIVDNVKNKEALNFEEIEILKSDLSKKIIRAEAVEAFEKTFNVENDLITPPQQNKEVLKDIELLNNELFEWIETTNWIDRNLNTVEELFVYPSYIYDKYKDYFVNELGQNEKFIEKRSILWNRFIELLNNKYSDKYEFDSDKRVFRKIGATNLTGFIIKYRETAGDKNGK